MGALSIAPQFSAASRFHEGLTEMCKGQGEK
jgi:hypothetical protein